MGLDDCVLFTGRIMDNDLFSSVYAVSDLFLFPSIFDNDPLVIVEAAVHKTPSLTIAGTGSSERIIDGVSGFVVNNDIEDFASKIIELINNKNLLKTVGENAQNIIPKPWSQTAKEYIDYYKQIISINRKVSKAN